MMQTPLLRLPGTFSTTTPDHLRQEEEDRSPSPEESPRRERSRSRSREKSQTRWQYVSISFPYFYPMHEHAPNMNSVAQSVKKMIKKERLAFV